MKKTAVLALGLVLVAGAALASNTGFKINKPLVFDPARSNNNWTSTPYFYYPNGNVGQTPQTALNFCFDLNGATANTSKVTAIIKFNTATDTVTSKGCAQGTLPGFNLNPGEGYSLIPNGAGITIDMVGSHDDAYAPNKGGTSTYPLLFDPARSNNNWWSVPYHVRADNALQLCALINGATANTSVVTAIIRFNTATDTVTSKGCAQGTLPGFDLVPGEGVSLIPNGTGKSVAVDVY